MSYTTIGSAIATILSTIPDLTIVGYEPEQLPAFPTATITMQGHKNNFMDTAGNRRVYEFAIRIYCNLADSQDAESMLRSYADQVISALESNIRLNNTCDYSTPTTGRVGAIEREVPVKYIEIRIEAQKRVLR